MRKKILNYLRVGFVGLFAFMVFACNDGINVNQSYSFDLKTMPVPKRIVKGDTVEIRCQIVKEGNYAGTVYYIRYFQPDGKGELKLGSKVLLPNDLYQLKNEEFRLYYTSNCTDSQTIDIYIVDSFGKVVIKSFSFSNENPEKS